jgi:hypothetical protein
MYGRVRILTIQSLYSLPPHGSVPPYTNTESATATVAMAGAL